MNRPAKDHPEFVSENISIEAIKRAWPKLGFWISL